MKWDVSAFHGMISVIQFMKRSIQNGDGVISELLSKKKKKKKKYYSPISHVIANYHDFFLINYLPKVQFHEKILSSSWQPI